MWNDDELGFEKKRDGNLEVRDDFWNEARPLNCKNAAKGCPVGTPENQRRLSEENQQCYEHYLECKAVGEFPDDAIVRRNAAVIRGVEDDFDRYERQKASSEQVSELIQLMVMK